MAYVLRAFYCCRIVFFDPRASRQDPARAIHNPHYARSSHCVDISGDVLLAVARPWTEHIL
jgi:hypothetical protein